MQFTLIEMWHSMGVLAKFVVFLLAFMSVTALTIMIERWWAFFQSKKQSNRFIEVSTPLFKDGKLGAVLEAAKKEKNGHVARVIAAGLNEMVTGKPGAPNSGGKEIEKLLMTEEKIEAASRAIQRETAVEVARFKKGTGGLATIGTISPFVGLFGTIFGIINAFQSMAMSGSGGLATVSAGIAEALITTALGIGVAIPAVAAFNYFVTKTENFVVEIDNSSSELIDYLIKEVSK